MALKCEDREDRIFKFLYNNVDGMLRQYEVPGHLSDDRIRDEINLMVSDVNREIPSSIGDVTFDILLKEIGRHVRRRHGARGWPSIKILLTATSAALEEVKLDDDDIVTQPRNSHQINAERIKNGDAVPEAWIYGQNAAELIHQGLIEEHELNGCRVALFHLEKGQFGEVKALERRGEREKIHESALRSLTQQGDLIDSSKVKAATSGFDFEEKKAG